MQTFLPYEDFALSAECLDSRRLNKQLVEAQQILKTLDDPARGWQNHPAVRMWRGHTYALSLYAIACYKEYKNRFFDREHKSGEYVLSVSGRDVQIVAVFDVRAAQARIVMPFWLGNSAFHRSHQSNLVRKDATFYGPKFPGVPDDLPYVWPVAKEDVA